MGAFTRPFFIDSAAKKLHVMRQFALLAILVTGVVASKSVEAQWQFSGAAGVRYVATDEIDSDGKKLVAEHGYLPGLELKADYRKAGWRFTFGGEVYGGNISYDGQMQSGMSFSTTTRTRQLRINAQAGRYISDATLLVAGAEWDYWKRDIQGRGTTLGLGEEYNSWRFVAGTETRVLRMSWADIDMTGLLVVSSPEHLQVSFDNQLFDRATLSTKPGIGARLAIEVHPKAFSRVTIESDFEWMRVNRSDTAILTKGGAPVGTVAQPEHVRKAIGLKVRYRF